MRLFVISALLALLLSSSPSSATIAQPATFLAKGLTDMFSTMRPINGEYVNLAPVVHGKTESGSSKDAQYVVYDMSAVLAKAAYFPEGTASDTNCRAEAFGLTNELAGKLVNCFDTEDKCGPGFTSAALLQKRADALRDADVAFQQHAKTWREARVAELEAKLEEAKVELARIEKDLGVDENTEPQTFEDQAYLDGQRGLVAELTEQIAFFKAKLQQQPIDKPREPKFCIWGVFDDESKIGTDPPDHFVVNIRGSTGMDEWAGKLADFSSMWEKGIVQHSYETYDAMTPDWAEDADMYYSTGSALARAPSLVTETFSEYLWGEGKTSCPNFMRRYGPLVGTDAFKDPLCTTQHRCPLADEHSCIPKYRYACQILLSIESIIQSKTPILFVGHSLAGGLASIATIYSVTNAVRTGTPRTEAEVLYRALAWAGAGGVYPSMYWGFATADDFPMEKSLMVIKDNYDVVSHASFQGGLLAKYRYLPPNWKTEASSHVHSMDGLSELRTRTPDYTEAPCRNWQRRQYWFVAPGPSIDQIKQFCNGEGRHKICVRKKIKIGEPLDVMWNFENVREFREGDMGFIGLYRGHCSDMSLENTPRSYVRVTHHVGFHSFGAQWQYRNVFRFNSFFREPGSYCVAFVKDNLRGWKWLSSYLPGWRRDEKDYQLLRYRTVWVSEASLQRFKAPINPLSVSNFLALAQRLGRTKPKVKASETDSGSGSDTGLAATQTGLWVGASMSMYTLSADMSSFDDLPAIAEAKEDTKIRDLLYSEMEKPEPLINTPCDASGEFVLHDGACVSVKAVKDADQGEKEVNQPIRLVCTEGQTTEDVCALKLPDTDDGFDDNVWDEFRRSWKIHAKNVEPAQADKLTADWKQACEAANQWWSAQPDKTNPRKALLGAHRASSSDSGEDESGSDGSSSSSPPRSQQKAKKTKKKSLAPR